MTNPFLMWQCLHRFSIRKFSVGVASAVIGTSVFGVAVPSVEADELSILVSPSSVVSELVETGQTSTTVAQGPDLPPADLWTVGLETDETEAPAILPEEEPAATQTLAEQYVPQAQGIVIEPEQALVPSDLVLNKEALPQDTRYEWVVAPEIAFPGQTQIARVLVTFSDESSVLLLARVQVRSTQAQNQIPVGKSLQLAIGQVIGPRDLIANASALPQETIFDWSLRPNTGSPGRKLARVRITYPDQSTEFVLVPILVRQSTDTASQPQLTLDQVANDNTINAEESQRTLEVSGRLLNGRAGDQVLIELGGVNHQTVLTGERFVAHLAGQALAAHRRLTAKLIRDGRIVQQRGHAYQVVTSLDKPEITINDVTKDNIVNLEESKNGIVISGLVNKANEGEEVTISCGCPTCQGVVEWVDVTTRVENGAFNITLPGNVVAANTLVKVKVTTRDQYGNTATETAEKPYDVDITPPAPSLTFNAITSNNIINQASPNRLTLSGQIINLQEGERVILTAAIGQTLHHVEVNGRAYELTLPKTVFEQGEAVRLSLSVTDRAGNKTTLADQVQTYTYDVSLSAPAITIKQPQTVTSQTEQVILSGGISHDEDVIAASVRVLYNGSSYDARLTDGHWEVTLPADQVTHTQGAQSYRLAAEVSDHAGNSARHEVTGTFIVASTLPVVTLTLDELPPLEPIGSETLMVTGRVTGHRLGDRVTTYLNNQKLSALIGSDGNFELALNRADLVANASRRLDFSIRTTDEHGNVGQEQKSLTYRLANPMVTEELTIDLITSDDHINVTEASKPQLIISGQAKGASSVQLTIGDQVVEAAVTNDRYSHRVDTKMLVTNPSYQVTAKVGEKVVHRSYTVADWATAQVFVTQIGEIEQGDTVRVSGRVVLEGLAAQYGNPDQLHEISLTIKDKTYYAGVDRDRRFNFNLPLSDLEAAKGEGVTFGQKGNAIYDIEPEFSPRGHRLADRVVARDLPQLTSQQVQFDNDHIFKDGKVSSQLSDKETQIDGRVAGSAKVGDVVTVTVGNAQFTTRVRSDKTFSLMLPSVALKEQDLLGIDLATENYKGQAIRLSDVVLTPQAALSADFKAGFEHSQTERPYFLGALTGHSPSTSGYLYRTSWHYDRPAEISYAFYNPGTDYRHAAITQANREHATRYLNRFAHYANVVFTQADEPSREWTPHADIVYYLRDNSSNNDANFGGNVRFGGRRGNREDSWRDWGTDAFRHLFTHETFHSFGAKHAHESRSSIPGAVLPDIEDQTSLSVMTYKSQKMELNPDNLKIYDLIYLHYRFGVNPERRSGNDTYRFQDFDRHQADGNIYVWDGGGIDTFDASHEEEGVTVDLTPGSWIYRGEKADTLVIKATEAQTIGNFFANHPSYNPTNTLEYGYFTGKFTHDFQRGQGFIGYGTQIERLIGSAHADTLKGNVANNAIYGGAGEDWIAGDAGDDLLDGGLGADTLDGGAGNDTFIVDNSGDTVIERSGEGTDTVIASVDYSLPEHVENLTLVGQATQGTGNAADNRITGNSLTNTLTGGGGQDTFVFNSPLNGAIDVITDFATDDVIELDSHVFTGIDRSNPFGRIHYDPTSGYLAYLPETTGQLDSIIFAKLPEGKVLRPDQIVVK